MFCRHCGNQLEENATKCSKCGYLVNSHTKKETVQEKSHVKAGLFALFLGGVGVHKFYLGNPLLGIMFLLFCWTGVPIVVGIVEGILYLSCPQDQFINRYGYKKEKK